MDSSTVLARLTAGARFCYSGSAFPGAVGVVLEVDRHTIGTTVKVRFDEGKRLVTDVDVQAFVGEDAHFYVLPSSAELTYLGAVGAELEGLEALLELVGAPAERLAELSDLIASTRNRYREERLAATAREDARNGIRTQSSRELSSAMGFDTEKNGKPRKAAGIQLAPGVTFHPGVEPEDTYHPDIVVFPLGARSSNATTMKRPTTEELTRASEPKDSTPRPCDRNCKTDGKPTPSVGAAKRPDGTIARLCLRHLQDEDHLVAGIPGVWEASLTPSGLHMENLRDRANQPTWAIQSGRSVARAFKLARAVWDQVSAAATAYEADRVLGAAGVKTHSWCAID